jgi:hypothetical protein
MGIAGPSVSFATRNNNEYGLLRGPTTVSASFTEIVESRGGFCHNLKQVFKYQRPSQEELRAFLFSDSERFQTFHFKYQKRKELGLIDSQGNLIVPE